MNEFERIATPAVEPRRPAPSAQSPLVSRTAEGAPLTADSVLHLQRTAGNATVAGMLGEEAEGSPVKDFLASSSGQSLDGPIRSNMEGALGADLSDVRIHRGGDASSSAATVQARAYTVGSDVVLGNDVNPASSEGQKTIAHELTHVVQQRSGPVDGTPAPGGIRLSDPSDRFEQAAESTANAVMNGGAAGPAVAAGGGGATAQREAAAPAGPDEEQQEEAVQGEFLQRQTTATDEENDEDKQAKPA